MRKLALLFVAAAGLTVTSRAMAADPCKTLPDEPATPIPKLYIESGDTQEFMIRALGRQLIKSANPLRVIYRNRPTCEIRVDMFGAPGKAGPAKMITVSAPTNRPIRYIPLDEPAAGADYPQCTVPDADTDADAQPIALGIGATYLSSCKDAINTTGSVKEYDGPLQAYGFITNNLSTQNGITAEEGFLAFSYPEGGGFPEGAADGTPWLVQNLRFVRKATASTTLTMSSNVHVDPTVFVKYGQTTPADKSSEIISLVNGATANAEQVLGVLGLDLYDADRSKIRVLPFRGFGQRYAWYPDSTEKTYDKQNVRDGHYLPWSPTPYMADSTGDGSDPDQIKDLNARRFYKLVRGFTTEADVDGLKTIAANTLIPQCAMKVTRDADGADLRLYSDPAPCGCYYEANVKGGTTKCATCTGAAGSACGTAGKCFHGYCEEGAK